MPALQGTARDAPRSLLRGWADKGQTLPMASGLAFLAAIMLGHGAVPVEMRGDSAGPDSDEILSESFEPVQHQLRVERRVIVRITPFSARRATSDMPVPSATELARAESSASDVKGGCIPLGDVAGVRLAEGRRILLFMRDRSIVSASFERSCPVQAFYSGFYVERPGDGMLCAGRERLHARSGADCTLGGFSRLPREEKDKD